MGCKYASMILYLGMFLSTCSRPVSDCPGGISEAYIDLREMNIDGVDLATSKRKLEMTFGVPDTISSFTNNVNQLARGQTYIYRNLGLTFYVFSDSAIVSNIDVASTSKVVDHPNVRLSRATKLSRIKSVFPEAYTCRHEYAGQKASAVLEFRDRSSRGLVKMKFEAGFLSEIDISLRPEI